jgi:glycogen debranching enzyme
MIDLVSLLDGNTFVVSDGNGDIEPSPNAVMGLFSFDTRFISTWVLTINGERMSALSVDDLQYFEARFFLVPGHSLEYLDSKLSVVRQRSIGGSFTEELKILSFNEEPVDLSVRVEVGSDFADFFEVKGTKRGKGNLSASAENACLRLGYQRGTFRREAVITSTEKAEFDHHGLTFNLRLESHGTWTTQLHVETVVHAAPGRTVELSIQAATRGAKVRMEEELDQWLARAPTLVCDNDALTDTYHRGMVDLAALRYVPLTATGRKMPAAGLPWFMTIFGRDSIFTSLQTLPFQPELAAVTLPVLGRGEGANLDDFRDEEPGKVLHEVRYGESAAFDEQPHTPYYGSADATPLYVVLLDEYERWTGDAELVRTLEFEARRALDWIDRYGDLLGNGYVWYERRNKATGLENQCWKDSWDSISYHDGRLPPLPRATCELQGYAYDAKIRGARMAREFWNDPAYAEQLEAEAASLKERFNRDFWIEDGQYYALALDRDGRPVDALSSNMGHLLWSGIVDDSRARAVADHLLGPRLFSGWGVRTLAVGEGRYNPIGYHVGTVWPFDNSIIAWGLRRYGFKEEAALIAKGIFEAAPFFRGRLPEAFAGYERELTRYPVQYPTACNPQAWSAGAPMLLLRTMLGLEPAGNRLTVDPALPDGVGRIELLEIPGRWGKIDALGRG